jgi:hypothetical protein
VIASKKDSIVCTARMDITPRQASNMLENNFNNRPLNPDRVAQFRSIIEEGKWMFTHQGIAFYEDGSVADGQHRLAAIASCGKTVSCMVTKGLSLATIHAIDCGRPRSVRDVFTFLGRPVTSGQVAVIRMLWTEYVSVRSGLGWSNRPADTEKLLVFADHVMPALEFATPASLSRGVSHASVTAAIAAAWFTQDTQKLKRFTDLVRCGVGADVSECAAIKLREFLLTTKITSGAFEHRHELYLRSCTAIRAFLEERSITKLYCRTDATFPIPDCPGIFVAARAVK